MREGNSRKQGNGQIMVGSPWYIRMLDGYADGHHGSVCDHHLCASLPPSSQRGVGIQGNDAAIISGVPIKTVHT